MSLARLSDPDIEQLEQDLLANVSSDGTNVGNVTLVSKLGWDKDLYYTVRDRLIDAGVLERGRGRGGSVRRVKATTSSAPRPISGPNASGPGTIPEVDLYEPVAGVLRGEWARDQRFENFVVEVTAKQGSRDTGGKWTRPDLVVVSASTYLFVPGKHLDVTTIEVKTTEGMDVTAVYEALAHLRSATRAYVFLHTSGETDDRVEAVLDQICDEAKRHGIGVIVASLAGEYEHWDERVEPIRHDPNPSRVNEFLSKQLSDGSKEAILKWWR